VKVAKGVKGKFSTAVCTAPATEKAFAFEWEPGPGPKAKFTASIKPETVATFETVTKKLVVSKGETSTGEYTGVKTVGNVVFTFTGCEIGASNARAQRRSRGARRIQLRRHRRHDQGLGIEPRVPQQKGAHRNGEMERHGGQTETRQIRRPAPRTCSKPPWRSASRTVRTQTHDDSDERRKIEINTVV